MARGPDSLDETMLAFLAERHLATLTTLRADGSPHVVAVGFGYDPDDRTVRIITFAGATKVLNAGRGGRAAVSQVDGPRWLTLEGTISATTDPDRVARAVAAYSLRYGEPKQRPDRVALEIVVDRILGRA